MTTDDTNDLDWLAFSYAAGELSPAEAEQFELRLADDQPACEALARAVELCQVVTAAEDGVVVFCNAKHGSSAAEAVSLTNQSRPTWNDRLSWMAIGGLASLLIAMLWTGVINPTWHTAKIHSFSQRNLAFAWAETKQEIARVREAGYWPTLAATADDYNTAATSFDAIDDEAPSWMTAALIGSSSNDATDADASNTESNS